MDTRRWVGGGNVPSETERINGTWPFAVLALSGASLSLALRPGWVSGLPLHATPADLEVVYPVTGQVVGGVTFGAGLGFVLPDGREWYFWTRKNAEVLPALTARGFPMTTEPRRPEKVWTNVP